ncbi:MAG: T9SS C-terminal target domain-containing protein [Flavobacteriales bacterium]|nr:MAG: T9SS C-terminal target domain-containing protein [Flavobacteriales bacterium]
MNTSDYFFNITAGIANENLPTPFDAVHAPDGNNLHVEITDGAIPTKGNNIAFTLDAINLIAPVSNPVLNNVYNYGEENLLSHSEVINNGVLHLYGNFNDSKTGQTPSPGGKHVYKLGVGCVADNLLVKDDGEIVLGDALVNNRAELIVMEGGSLDLGANGKLKVQNGSKLVIEDGGNFSFEDGAQIELLGPDAVLEIRGKVTVGDNATFTFNGNGRVIIDQFIYSGVRDNFWDIGQNASFILEGHTNYGQVLLECKSNFSPVTESNRTFKLVKIHKAKVHVHPGKHLSLTGPVDIQRVEFDLPNGMSTNNLHDGLKIWGRHNNSSWIRYNRFLNGNYGIRANQAVTNPHPLFLHGNHFENNDHGLYITGQSYTVRASTFVNNNYGIYGTELHGTGQIVASTFQNNATAILLSGQGGSETQISDNTIDATLLNAGFAEPYGVVLEDYAVSLNCNSFSNLHNAVRFFGEFASVELSEDKKNEFTDINVAIYGDISNGYFNMLNGENGFFQNTSDIAILATGTLNGPASSQNANWLDISNNRIPVQTFSPFSNVNLVSANFTGVFNPTSNQNRAFSACSGGPGYSSINEVREVQNFNSNLWVVPPGSGGGILIDMITQAGLKITNSNEESEFLDDQQGFNELLFIVNVLLNEYATLTAEEKQVTTLVLRMLEKALHQLYKQGILAYNDEYDVTSIAQEISSLNAVIAQFIALQGVPTDTASHERITALNLKMIHNLRQGGYLQQAVQLLTNNYPLNVGPRMMSRWMYWDCVINTEAAFMQGLIDQDMFEINLMECITSFAPRVSNTSIEIPEQSLEVNDFAVELYPNPSSDYLYFRTPGIEDPETPLRVSINNIFGAEVYHNSTTATFVHRIDLQSLPAGAYVLKVEALGKTKTSKFLVVR